MKRTFALILILLPVAAFAQKNRTNTIEFRDDALRKEIGVYVSGKHFTTYRYAPMLEKQVLYPVMTASGKEITRGYPLNPRPYERTDHPHHVGVWFNFGSVNGLDFWNNSFAVKPEERSNYGRIVFRRILSENPAKGELKIQSDWVDALENVLMTETATYRFGGDSLNRTIERTTVLKAKTEVTLLENKEGLIAIRMDRAFEEPATKPERFLDANGKMTDVPVLNNDGVNGVYRNAEGIAGSEVWGNKSPWVALRAEKEGEVITVAILDHKTNYGYPAWSHARGYGLFASNNLGGRAFDPQAPELKIVLKPGQSITFRHKIVVAGDLSDAQLNALADAFNK